LEISTLTIWKSEENGMDIYDELGVRKIINGHATLTMLGGSIMPPEVIAAMNEAAQHFVDIDELQEKVGKKIAEWTHNEAAYVSCGAAAGLVLSTAACIAGTDPEKRAKLPFTDGMKNEVIIHKSFRMGYDFAICQAGGRLVEIGTEQGATAEDLENAINERTAEIFVFYRTLLMEGQVPLEQQFEIGRRHGIPVVVDAAAQLPPVENLWRLTQMGASLILFSGGKGLCGPQSSGLILGRRDLIEACAFNANPRGFIGRPMKVGKEECVGLMAAVKWYLSQDHIKWMQEYEDFVVRIKDAFANVPHVTARRDYPNEAGKPMPRAELIFDTQTLGITRDELLHQLYYGSPSISLGGGNGPDSIVINPQTLQPGEEEIIVERIKAILKTH
jgi:D-glucosaminate-6-phosphate ammonia-lyase